MISGRDAFVRLGYHQARVDDIVEAAGVSHGAFYRYFTNKDHIARMLTAQAMQTVSVVLSEIPTDAAHEGQAGRAALRRWLRRYNATQADEAAMLQVWTDAALQDETTRSSSAPALDWGRRQTAEFLRPREFGDIDTEGARPARRAQRVRIEAAAARLHRCRGAHHPAGLPRPLTDRPRSRRTVR